MAPWVTLTILALAAALFAEYRRLPSLLYVSKPVASAGFIGAAVAAGGLETSYGRVVFLALVLSWVGDVFLMFARSSMFLAGLAAFLAAHVAYGGAFLLHGQSLSWTLTALGVLTVPAIIVGGWLHPHLPPPMRMPVWAYIAAITAMLSLAIGARGAGGHFLIPAGALCFYISDISVARDRFIAPRFANRLWGLPLYYGAQLLLASSTATRTPLGMAGLLW